jgi:hypothetical protein
MTIQFRIWRVADPLISNFLSVDLTAGRIVPHHQFKTKLPRPVRGAESLRGVKGSGFDLLALYRMTQSVKLRRIQETRPLNANNSKRTQHACPCIPPADFLSLLR